VLAALRELGCDAAQGYHIARPAPADEMTVWLRAAFGGDGWMRVAS
jgi:EAL domain-containing protein (putative c-di-GMP-specific phosphodiesterase class I)